MKKLLLIPIAAILLAACSKDPITAEFNGKFENLDVNFALISSKGLTDTLWLQADGTFSKVINITTPTYFTVRAARISNTVYIAPGDVLTFNFDVKAPEVGPKFTGKTAAINSYIFIANGILSGITKDFRGLYSLQKEVFVQKLDSVKNEVKNQQATQKITSKEFLSFEDARIDYRIKSLIFDYPSYNARFNSMEHIPSSDDFAFMKEVDLNNTKLFGVSEYTSLVSKYLQSIHYMEISKDENKGKSEFERSLMYFELVDSMLTNQEMKDFLKYSSTSETVKWESLEVAKNVAEHFITNALTPVYSEAISKALAKRMLLAPGQPAPDFSITGIDGKTYTLADFKGKIVYIDFWATWCGPCRREIPFLKKVKEAYHNKPVAFIAISLDDDKAAWEKMVNEEPLTGYQLHAEKAWSSDVAKQYQIYGIPTFVLIDGEGKILEYPATRPSDSNISLLLDKYIKQL